MKAILTSIVFSGLLFLSNTILAQTRITQDFNSGWKFCQCDGATFSAPGFNDSGWNNVTTPHSWNNLDGQDGGNNYSRGIGWYRKQFSISNTMAGKRVFVKFNAVNMSTDVYVNGNYTGSHTGGYSAFVFDISGMVNIGGSNVIAVKVNNSDTIKAAPLDADFTFFGGINRSVELLYTDAIHITPLDYGSPGVYITQQNVSAAKADISFKALVKNDAAASAGITANFIVTNAAGSVVQTASSTSTLPAGSQTTFNASTTINNPILWNGLSNPYLYSVKTQILIGGTVVDEVIQPLGIRFYSVDPNTGFYLNGSSYRLHGVAHHEDRKDKGRAISDQNRKEDLDILKELGCNYLRLTHYQHGQYTYNYCDSTGIAVWTEIPLIDKIDGSQTFTDNTKNQLTELIRQNYNHPSVIVWGLSNEITYKAGPDPTSLVQQLNTLAHQLDSTRLTASAAMSSTAPLNFYSNVYSCNVYNGWYYNTYNDFGTWATNQHNSYPTNSLGVSEYGAGANVTQHEPLNPAEPANYGPWHPEEYQALFHEAHWQQILARPFLWSTSVWVGFDFASDGRNEGMQPGINDKGLVTRDRLVKKDAFYYYKANWTMAPFTYITSRRYSVRYDSVLTAKVYSNCDSVKLKVNSTMLTAKTSTTHIYSWANVSLSRGLNTIVSIGYKNGLPCYDTCYWQFNGPYTISIPAGDIQINFETPNTVTPAGYLKDGGSAYGDRGNGYFYGWSTAAPANTRERNADPVKTFDTFMQMQVMGGYNFWEIALPNGKYVVSIVAGDPNYFDSYNAITAEATLVISDPVYSSRRHVYGSDTVNVTDGRLSIRPGTGYGATNAKINLIHITPVQTVVTSLSSTSTGNVVIYPNPASTELTILNIKETVNIKITNMLGNEIGTHENINGPAFNLSTVGLPKGLYLVEINGLNTHSVSKVIIE